MPGPESPFLRRPATEWISSNEFANRSRPFSTANATSGRMAYAQAERSRAQLWVAGRDGLEFLPANWRSRAGWPVESTRPGARQRLN